MSSRVLILKYYFYKSVYFAKPQQALNLKRSLLPFPENLFLFISNHGISDAFLRRAHLSGLIQQIDEERSSDGGRDDAYGEFSRKEEGAG